MSCIQDCGVIDVMTRGQRDAERRLAAEIDSSIPDVLRREWDRHVAREQVVVARQGIFSPRLNPFGYELGFRAPGATGVDAPSYSEGRATSVRLSLESHEAVLGPTAGVHTSAMGGVDLEARLGAAMIVNYIGIDARAPLPSDRTLGMSAGARLSAPSLARIAERPMGFAPRARV